MELLASKSVYVPTGQKGRTSLAASLLCAVGGASAFHLAFLFPHLNALILLFAFGVFQLTDLPSMRWAFRSGFLVGMLVFAPQLFWLWNIFGSVAICLWAVLSLFPALFVMGIQLWRGTFANKWVCLAAPCLWTALEYFRSELYFLKFSWLSVGYAFSIQSGVFPAGRFGVYGSGFFVFLAASLIFCLRTRRGRALGLAGAIFIFAVVLHFPATSSSFGVATNRVNVAGVQLEFPPELEIPRHLDAILEEFPATELVVLSEYTFDAAVPSRVRSWCKAHRKYLMAGGKEAVGAGRFYNTAFVIDPEGEIVFKQVKSVPIQFFKDGLAAPTQKVWDSPWGKVGICVCYDLSYRRVVDRLVGQGAQALIVPFMDVTDWGAYQHQMHSLVSPLRAKEYGIPIFRIGSSGISQLIDSDGWVRAQGSFPGQGEIIGGALEIRKKGRLPLDHWLAPASVFISVFFAVAILLKITGRSKDPTAP